MKKLFLTLALAFQVFNYGVVAAYDVKLQEAIGDTTNITGDTGVDLVADYIEKIYKYGAAIISIICVLIIVVSGIQIIFGGVAAEGVTEAKSRIFQALFSLILLFSSALILRTINPGFFKGAFIEPPNKTYFASESMLEEAFV